MPPKPNPPKNKSHKTRPYHISHPSLGHLTGLTYLSPSSKPLCHYLGGVPYALPPTGSLRFRPPRPLPPDYRYGTRAKPGVFTGGAKLCPQPGFGGKADERQWDEDCLQLNVWIPAGEMPEGGWPVCVFLHGGFLQFGTPNTFNLTALLSETTCKAIFVLPAYRVNVFGFLASHELASESSPASSSLSNTTTISASLSAYHTYAPSSSTVGNYGFHDQRLALLWTSTFISSFGGDPSNLTLLGHSAGAHSTFHQLAHDIFLSAEQRLIKRAFLISNGAGMQPKSLAEVQPQFDALLTALGIPLDLPAHEKTARLRDMPARTLVQAAGELDLHEFRACADVSDGAFIRSSLFSDIDSGVFARQLRDAGVQVMLGEVSDEHWVYAGWRSPKKQTFESVRARLEADYPRVAIDAVLDEVYCPTIRTESGRVERPVPAIHGQKCGSWHEAFGRIYADLQVHALERGFVAALERHGAGDLVRRYRIEWRAACVGRAGVPKKFGVTHGTDMTSVWFFGNGVGGGLSEGEKKVVKNFAGSTWEWMCGRGWGSEENWDARGSRECRVLRPDGSTGTWADGLWKEGVKVWEVGRKALRRGKRKGREAKL